MTYLLFEASNELSYIKDLKTEIDEEFKLINKKTPYLIKKSIRKILRNIKKHIRYSRKKETEVELLLYFCTLLKQMTPSIKRNATLQNIYDRQIESIKKTVASLHEDLQYDYEIELRELE